MKPDGGTMETTEPSESAAGAESASSQENVTQQLEPQPQEAADTETAGASVPQVNGRPVAEVKPKTAEFKVHHKGRPAGGAAMSSPRPGPASSRTANNNASQNAASAAAGRTTVARASGAVPKRPAAASSTLRNPTREPNKTSAGPARTAPAASATNGSRPAAPSNSLQKRTAPGTVNGARPKTTLSSGRTMAATTSRSTTSTTTKVGAAAASAKTTRPTAGPSAVRPFFATTRPSPAGGKSSSTTSAAKTTASRVTTAPPAGRPAATQLPKSAAPAAKKDVSRPASTAAARKPTASTASAATRKPDPTKLASTVKLGSVSKQPTTTKAADTKVLQLKARQLAKPASAAATKTVDDARLTAAINTPSKARMPPASPATRPGVSNLGKAKYEKPTQNVSPFTVRKKIEVSKATTSGTGAQRAAGTRRPAGPKGVDVAAASVAAEVVPKASCPIASAPEEVPTMEAAPAPQEVGQSLEVVSLPQPSPISTAPPEERSENSSSLQTAQEEIPAPAQPAVLPVAPDSSKETGHLSAEQSTSASAALPAGASAISPIPSTNLNEEEDEEEREGSQLVSVSEMSGTTQPTEESRPGSAGPAAGSAWRAGGALLSELDSEEVSGSQQGASELSAPGVLEGTESMDDLGDGSLKGAIDMEGASAGSPDFEKVPDIPVNDFDEDEDEDDSDRVCDMDVGSERADEQPRPRHDNDVDDEDDDDVEMASEGVTESGLESYGNADEDDFAEDERLDNLNRMAQPPPPPVLPSAPAAQWDQPNPFADPWAEALQPEQTKAAVAAVAAADAIPLPDPWQLDSKTPTQAPAQAWLELGSDPLVPGNQEVPDYSSVKDEQKIPEAQIYSDPSRPAPGQNLIPPPPSAPGMSLSSTLSSETSTPEDMGDYNREGKLQHHSPQPNLQHQDLGAHAEKGVALENVEPDAPPAEAFGGPATAPTSNPSSSSVSEDEASDTEGEAQLEESLEAPVVVNLTFDCSAPAQRCLSTVEEGEEAESGLNSTAAEDATPPSATSMASYGFDTMTTTSTSNAQSTGESCIKSPGIFSLEELPEEAKEPHAQPCLPEQHYIECGKEDMASEGEHDGEAFKSEEGPNLPPAPSTLPQQEENPDDVQPPYYSAICEKTEDSFTGLSALPLPHRRDHAAYPRTYYDIVKQQGAAAAPPKLTCADLPPRSPAQQALSPQLRRLEQHQRQLQEMQQRRAQQGRPLEEAEQERKRREEEEQRRKKEEAEEEIKRNEREEDRRKEKEEELLQRKDLELQLQQQQEELKQRQQIMQWQQELLQTQGQSGLLSPSSGLCTIYEALENSGDEEAEGETDGMNEVKRGEKTRESKRNARHSAPAESRKPVSGGGRTSPSDSPPPTDSLRSSGSPSSHPPESPERPPPLDLDWGKKVDIVQQLINQTLMLNGDGCSSLLLLPGGAGGTLSPLESSLWPSLLPPLTPPSATVTSVSSFSPEATGSAPQGEWTVVELETHH